MLEPNQEPDHRVLRFTRLRNRKRVESRLPTDQYAAYLQLTRAEACRRSFYRFFCEMWGEFRPMHLKPNWHHQAICEHFEAWWRGEIRDLLVCVPPRHLKSSLLSVASIAWGWAQRELPLRPGETQILGRDGKPLRRPPGASEQFMVVSHNDELALDLSKDTRRLIESNLYQAYFGDMYEFAQDQNTKHRFDTNRGGYRTAMTIGSSPMGAGCNKLICDDPHDARDPYNKAKNAQVMRWWSDVMPTRMNDPRTASRLCVMQRIGKDDLASVMIEQGWTQLCIPARFDPQRVYVIPETGWYDPRTEEGELLHPERMPEVELKKIEEVLGPTASAAQLQQEPKSLKGNIIQRSWLRRYRKSELPAWSQFSLIISVWDCASKEKEENDFTVGQVWGLLGTNQYWLLDSIRGHWRLSEMATAYAELTDRWRRWLSASFVEDKAAGPQFVQLLEESMPGILPWSAGMRDKVMRLRSIEPAACAGNLWIPADDEYHWVIPYVDELCEFPKGKNDDQVDTTTMAVMELRGGGSGAGGLFLGRA